MLQVLNRIGKDPRVDSSDGDIAIQQLEPTIHHQCTQRFSRFINADITLQTKSDKVTSVQRQINKIIFYFIIKLVIIRAIIT